jgi:hypothetical protein
VDVFDIQNIRPLGQLLVDIEITIEEIGLKAIMPCESIQIPT